MTLYTQVSRNRLKTVWYFILFSALLLALGYFISLVTGSSGILLVFGVITVIQGLVGWYSSDKVAILTSGAKPLAASSLPLGQQDRLEKLVTNLTMTAGLPMPKLYIIEDTAMNAFATGRDANHSALAFTTGIVQSLDDNELAGVIAHELSHIGNEDIRVMSIVMVMAGLVALISDYFLRSMFWGGSRRREEGGGALIILALVLAILAPLASFLIQMAVSRKREYMADANAVLLTRYPEGMISALQKISGDTEPLEAANRGNAHMYFANPFKSGALKALFSTHPTIESRIEAIRVASGMDVK